MTEEEFRNGTGAGKAAPDGDTIRRKIGEVTATAEAPGNAHADHYMRGMANGLILARSIANDIEVSYIEADVVFDYMTEADKTCSIVFNPQNVDRANLLAILKAIAGSADELNFMKKLFFRGKTPAELDMPQPTPAESVAVEFDPVNSSEAEVNLLHGLIGVITEAGEMAEVLIRRLETGVFDPVNVFEEAGDVHWYQARILRGLKANFDQLGKMNIDKLRGRHGTTFNVERDWNRDLATERAKLEEAAAPLFEHAAEDWPDAPLPEPEPGPDPVDVLRQRAERGRADVRRAQGDEEPTKAPPAPGTRFKPQGFA